MLMDLVGRAHLTWKRHVARNLTAHGITPKQIFVLRQLSARPTLTPSEVAELLFADRPTATVMLRTLEREGWITRRRDPKNGKRVLLALTPAGAAKLESVPERLWRSGRTQLDPEAGLSTSERAELARLLTKLTAHLEAAR